MNNKNKNKNGQNRPANPSNRRPNPKSKRSNNQVANSSSTTSAVQRRIRANSSQVPRPNLRVTQLMDVAYARCRLDPFNAGPSMGIPDSNASNKLVFDHRSVEDFTVSNGSVSIIIAPTTPNGSYFKPDAAAGGVLTLGTSITQASTFGNTENWIPGNYYQDILSPSNTPMDPRNNAPHPISNKVRLVGVGWRLITTSPASNVNGIVEVITSDCANDSREINSVALQQLTANDANGLIYAVGAVDNFYVNFDASSRYQATTSKTVQLRPEMQPQGVLKHSGPYLWETIHESPILPIVGSSNRVFVSERTGVGYGGLYQWDSAFSITRLRINCGNACTFRLETVACVEYVIAPNSPFSRLALPKTKVDSRSVELVDAAIANMPAAATPTQTTSFLSKLFSAVSKSAGSVGAMFGPLGATIGSSVSMITDALSNIL